MIASPLSILFVHYGDDWLRGSERVLLDLVANLDRKKWAPTLWCNGRLMAGAARALDIPVIHEDLAYFFDFDSPGFSATRYIHQVRHAIHIARDSRARVIHCNGAAPLQWCVPAGWRLGLPVLAHLHAATYFKRTRYVTGMFLADALVGVSGPVLDYVRRDRVEEARLYKVFNGIDRKRLDQPAQEDLRSTLGLSLESVVAAVVASLVHHKGIDIALGAVARLRASHPKLHLLVIGDGPDRAALADGLVQQRVHALGERGDVGPILRDAVDFLVVPSRRDAAPLVIAEAAAFGVPTVGSRVGGIPEMIDDGRSGLLVPSEDVDAFASAMGRICDDAKLRKELGRRARELFEERFAMTAMTGAFGALYGDLAGRSQPLGARTATMIGRLRRALLG